MYIKTFSQFVLYQFLQTFALRYNGRMYVRMYVYTISTFSNLLLKHFSVQFSLLKLLI